MEVVCFVLIFRYHLVYKWSYFCLFFSFSVRQLLATCGYLRIIEQAFVMELMIQKQQLKKIFLSVWSNNCGTSFLHILLFSFATMEDWRKYTSVGHFWTTRMCLNIIVAFENACFIWQNFRITFSPLRITFSVEMLPYATSCFHHFCWWGNKKKRTLTESMISIKHQDTANTLYIDLPMGISQIYPLKFPFTINLVGSFSDYDIILVQIY